MEEDFMKEFWILAICLGKRQEMMEKNPEQWLYGKLDKWKRRGKRGELYGI
jgi:hypothetical protein